MKQFLKDNWFKISILIILVFVALIAYNVLVVQPQKVRDAEQSKITNEQAAEQERKDNLKTCLEESEYQRSTAHLAVCGDPNVGHSSEKCFKVFSGTSSYSQVVSKYKEIFPNSWLSIPSGASVEEMGYIFKKNDETLNDFWENCNCGLEKYRRDDLDVAKEKRDETCYKLYSPN